MAMATGASSLVKVRAIIVTHPKQYTARVTAYEYDGKTLLTNCIVRLVNERT